jgi:hypothetical protein
MVDLTGRRRRREVIHDSHRWMAAHGSWLSAGTQRHEDPRGRHLASQETNDAYHQ